MIPTHTFAESQVSESQPKYEIEIEVLNDAVGQGTAFNSAKKLADALRSAIKTVMSGLQGTNYPVGAAELALIAQDTSGYGRDHGTTLASLLSRLAKMPGDFRIRVMYLYPSRVDDALLDAFAADKVVPYFEIPLQHVSDRVLAAMGRRYRRRDVERLVERIALRFGDRAVLRTTFIAGFPGETAAEHAELRRFIAAAPFDYIGLFGYSKEEGTAAGAMRSHRRATVAARLEELRAAAQGTMERRLARFLGATTTVLYEEYDPGSILATGRGHHQAPEIDGVTILTNLTDERPGELLKVRLTGRDGVDFTAEVAPGS